MTKTALAESAENLSREHVHGGFLVGVAFNYAHLVGPNLSTLDDVLLKTHHSADQFHVPFAPIYFYSSISELTNGYTSARTINDCKQVVLGLPSLVGDDP